MEEHIGVCAHLHVEWRTDTPPHSSITRGWWECRDCQRQFIPLDPRIKREAVAADIAMREHVEAMAGVVRQQLERFLRFEVFSTQKDDHTKSLSDRVTYLEGQLGELRETWRQHRAYVDWERSMTTWQLIRRRLLAVRWRWPFYEIFRD